MLRIACLLAIALGISSARGDDAAPASSVRERVDAYLGAIDRPIPATAWKALGPEAVPLLQETLASDPLTPRRAAAASALAAIGGDEATAALVQAARAESERWPVRSAALRGLGVALAPDALTEALRPIMENAAPSAVRAAAAEVLARHAPTSSCAAIRAQAMREGPVREAGFTRATSRCGAR